MVSSRADRHRLENAPLEVIARFASASNLTLLCRLGSPDAGREPSPDPSRIPAADLAVYKPRAGETPLWDFPDGTLHQREVAACVVDRSLGWGLVPETVLRDDGPMGPGAVQAYVPHDPHRHYFSLLEAGDPATLDQLERMVLFDLVIDNADRKGGHVLLADDTGLVQLVDHGVSFHVEPKLRTVAWHFAGEEVPAGARRDLRELVESLRQGTGGAPTLSTLLSRAEYRRLEERAEAVAELERFPGPTGPRPYPWPLL